MMNKKMLASALAGTFAFAVAASPILAMGRKNDSSQATDPATSGSTSGSMNSQPGQADPNAGGAGSTGSESSTGAGSTAVPTPTPVGNNDASLGGVESSQSVPAGSTPGSGAGSVPASGSGY